MAIQALCGSQPRSRPAASTAAGPKESFLSFPAPHAGADMFPQLTLAYCASREKLRAELCPKLCFPSECWATVNN